MRTLAFCLLLFAAFARGADERTFTTLADIEAALDPLEFLADDDGIRRSIDLNIRFRLGSAELLPAAHRQIEVLATALNGDRLRGYDILLVGHTDAQGDAAMNQRLSEARAGAVHRALVERYGVEADRLQAEGRGETELLVQRALDDAAHRRVEIVAVPADPPPPRIEERADEDAAQGYVPIDW